MEQTLKSASINYGLYLGAALTLFTILGYAFNLNLLVNLWIILLVIPLFIIGFGIVSTAKAKGALNGYLSFKQAFSSFFITVAVAILISTFINIVLFDFIDPKAAIELKSILIEQTTTMLENANAPADKISESIYKIESQDTYALGTQVKSLAQSLIFFAVIGLLVAAAMKKTNPNSQ